MVSCESIGDAAALHAEIWAVYTGMKVAWDQGFRKIIVESDSQDAMQLIREPIAFHFSYNLIRP